MEWNINDVREQAALQAAEKVGRWKETMNQRLFGEGGKKPTKRTNSSSGTSPETNKKKFQAKLTQALRKHPEYNTPEWILYFTTIADLETGGTFNENAMSKNSSAQGYFQILKASRKTGNQFEDMFNLTASNQKALVRNFGQEGIKKLLQQGYTMPELMALSHFQGASGAATVLRGGKGRRDANGVTPNRYLDIFRSKWPGSIAGIPTLTVSPESIRQQLQTPITPNNVAQLNPDGTVGPVRELDEVQVIGHRPTPNLAMSEIPDDVQYDFELTPTQTEITPIESQFADIDDIFKQQLKEEIQNILLQDPALNTGNSVFKYALAEDPQEKARKLMEDIAFQEQLNQAALGGPLFNSRTPIESFQGKKAPLPIVRYDEGGELPPNTWREDDYEDDKPTHNADDLRVKNEMMQYVQSPLFKQRAETTFMKSQQNPEHHYNILESTLMLERNPDFANTAGYYSNENKVVISQNAASPYSTRASTANHELSHGRHDNYSFYKPDMREALQQMDTSELNVRNIYGKWGEGLKEHDDLIYERAAIVNEVRQLMKDSGIWDYTSGNPFTEEHFKQLHEKFPRNRFTNYFSDPEKLKTAIWLQNNLAYNPQRQQNDINYAALGGNLFSGEEPHTLSLDRVLYDTYNAGELPEVNVIGHRRPAILMYDKNTGEYSRGSTGDILTPINTSISDNPADWTYLDKNGTLFTPNRQFSLGEITQGQELNGLDKLLLFSNQHYNDPIMGAAARWAESWHNDRNPVKAGLNYFDPTGLIGYGLDKGVDLLNEGTNALGAEDAIIAGLTLLPFTNGTQIKNIGKRFNYFNPTSLLNTNIRTHIANDKVPYGYVLADRDNYMPFIKGLYDTVRNKNTPLVSIEDKIASKPWYQIKKKVVGENGGQGYDEDMILNREAAFRETLGLDDLSLYPITTNLGNRTFYERNNKDNHLFNLFLGEEDLLSLLNNYIEHGGTQLRDEVIGNHGGMGHHLWVDPTGRFGKLSVEDTFDLMPLLSMPFLPKTIQNIEVSSILPGYKPFHTKFNDIYFGIDKGTPFIMNPQEFNYAVNNSGLYGTQFDNIQNFLNNSRKNPEKSITTKADRGIFQSEFKEHALGGPLSHIVNRNLPSITVPGSLI